MKKISIILSTLMFTGCAVLDAYLMAPYDANEYMQITEIRTNAIQYRRQCDNPILAQVNAQSMANRTELYEKYQEQIPRNANGFKSAQALNEIAQGLNTAYVKGSVSPVFCKLKYNNIEHSAELIQRVTAGRPRR
jgi:uncharacterized protein (DUF2342 family)